MVGDGTLIALVELPTELVSDSPADVVAGNPPARCGRSPSATTRSTTATCNSACRRWPVIPEVHIYRPGSGRRLRFNDIP